MSLLRSVRGSDICDELLDKKSFECDPLADNAVLAAVRDRGKNVLRNHELCSTVKEMARTDLSCARFVAFYEQEPPWNVEWKRHELGRRLFVRNSLIAGLVLLYGSLVFSLAVSLGNKVLSAMGRLSSYGDVRQRVFETLYFVKVVVRGSQSEIKEVCMRVRLLHAAVRYHLCHRDGGWEIEEYGHPINQEHLAGTLSMFSYCVMEGLEFLGVSVTENEKDGYQKLWKYVGYYLGMTSDLLCDNYKDEWKLWTLIKVRQCKPDEDSVIMTNTLLQQFANKPPFHLSYTTASSLSRYMIGNELADKLGLLSFNVLGQIVLTLLYWFLRTVSFIQRGFPPLEWRMYTFGSHCLNIVLKQSLKGRKPSYIMKVYS